MASKIKWEDANFNWNNNPHTWDEVALVIEAISGPPGEGDDFIHPLFDKDPEKRKKLVVSYDPLEIADDKKDGWIIRVCDSKRKYVQ